MRRFSLSDSCVSLGILFFIWITTPAAHAEVPDALEPEYSEAVIAYNAKDYRKAIGFLDPLILKSPQVSEFLELKALSLKASQNDPESAKVYAALIQNKRKEKRPESELAPYQFELAMILQRTKRFDLSRRYFESALEQNFNPGVCHMYLGMAAFNSGEWQSAERHFNGVVASETNELKPAAYFYLGQAYTKMEYPSGATQNFVNARNSSRAAIDSEGSDPESRKIAQQIFISTEQALAPYDRGQLFGHAGILTGYDSNVAAIPSTVTSAAETSGKATIKNTLLAGVGYASSSLGAFQFVPSYKGSIDYNLNKDARASQFATNVVSLYVTRSPLARLSYGMKLEGDLQFKNDVDPATKAGTYRIYSKGGSFGPYLRYEAAKRVLLSLEFTINPVKYDQDSTDPNSDQRRSGTGSALRLAIQNDQGTKYFNPTAALQLSSTGSQGREYDAGEMALAASNFMRFSEKLDVSPGLNYSRSSYSKRSSGERKDKLFNFQVVGSYKIKPKWTILGNLDYTTNSSTVEATYSYNRVSMASGITYSF